MAGQAQLKEITGQERKEDCGCGCEGAPCGTAHQEMILVGFPRPAAAKEVKAGQCGCGCDGECGCGG